MTLVQAIPRVALECPDAQFVFTGPVEDSGYFKGIKKFVEQKGLSRWVRFTGTLPQEELYRLYRDAAIFAFPTLGEMFPQVLIEALGFGLPVVASRIPSVAEIVEQDRGAAILVAPNDASAYASTIASLLRDTARRKIMSASAKRIAQLYSCAAMARETLVLYERWANSFRRAQ